MSERLLRKTLVFIIAVLFITMSIIPVSSLSINHASSESTIKTINGSSSIATSLPVHNIDTGEDYLNIWDDIDRELYERHLYHYKHHLWNHSEYLDEPFSRYPEYDEFRDTYRQRFNDEYVKNHTLKDGKPTPKPNFANGKTWYVDDDGGADFTKIQDAIDAAKDGDTIFVYNGIYYENVVVDKSIILEGEDKNTTIIDGGGNSSVVRITAGRVNISMFTINNSGNSGYPYPGSYAGIEVHSDYNSFNKNIIKNNECGIYLYGSIKNNISGNTIMNNMWEGIRLWETSNNNTVYANNIINNGGGTDVFLSSNDTITDNTFISNGVMVDGIRLHEWNTHTIENNYANGQPIYYYKNNHDGFTIPLDAAQVILANCSNFRIGNLTVENVDTGIQIAFSDHIIVDGSIIKNNKLRGIDLSYSFNSSIVGSDISNNNDDGIILWYAFNNIIAGNNITHNGDDGIECRFDSNNNSIMENTISNNNEDGIDLTGSTNNSLIGNTITDNGEYGICIYYESNENTINGNTVFSNFYDGIFLLSSSDNEIFDCTINNHTLCGISLEKGWGISSENNIIQDCYIFHNWRGIKIDSGSTSNKIKGCLITNNHWGIKLADSTNNIIEQCTIANNTCGVMRGKGNFVRRNNFIDNNILHAFGELEHVNSWGRNYWSGHDSSSPYYIYGLNFDWFPKATPYDYPTRCDVLDCNSDDTAWDWNDNTPWKRHEELDNRVNLRDGASVRSASLLSRSLETLDQDILKLGS